MKTTSIKLKRLLVFCVLGVCGLMSVSQVGWAQTDLASAGSSYDALWREFKPGSGTKAVDPNVYVYTPEFAKRFQMPAEWVSTDLKGADAVAFRVTPDYVSCGWGGDPKACNTHEVHCQMDLYFDHKRNPLPWDERFPEVVAERSRSSSRFIPAPYRESRLPQRANDNDFAKYSPFVDPKTGKGLGWQDFVRGPNGGGGGGWTALLSYDKEIFSGMSLVTLLGSCTSPEDEVWLASEHIYPHDVPGSPQLNRRIELPIGWKIRVKEAQRESRERSTAFFKHEGEKAMKALRESPVPSKSIIPAQ